jgi:hypothetical protein
MRKLTAYIESKKSIKINFLDHMYNCCIYRISYSTELAAAQAS